MSKNTFQLDINGTNYSTYINYPVEYNQKNYTEAFNTYALTLNRMVRSDSFSPNQKVTLNWLVDDTLYKSFYTLLVSDAVEKIGNLAKYKHNLNLIEFTYYLELINLPDMTITRVEGVYEPTLADVVERILEVAAFELNGTASLNNIVMSDDADTLLSSYVSPE